jgi:hypothetical protein
VTILRAAVLLDSGQIWYLKLEWVKNANKDEKERREREREREKRKEFR